MSWKDQFASQHGEDSWLCDHWGLLKLPDYGFFVEFGAGDGVNISNTYWLEKSRGWHGLLCEPEPRNLEKLKACGRDRSKIEAVAIGPPGIVDFGCPEDAYLSGTLRTTDDEKEVIRAQQIIRVPSLPLSDVLAKHGVDGLDIISIDTEGTELEAWRTLNLKRWRPRIAIIELITWGLPDQSEEIVQAMDADGYEMILRTHHNGVFLDRDTARNSTLQYFRMRMRVEREA